MAGIVMYMADNGSFTMALRGVQGYGNNNANISIGDILGLWKRLRTTTLFRLEQFLSTTELAWCK